MAITVENWGKRVELTGTTPASSTSNFVALITEANLPAEIWGLAENGGGDLRVCLDAEGTNQLSIEVVLFNTITEKAVIYVKIPNYTSGATSLWLFYNKAGESQPAVASSFGRNSVWADFEYVFHFTSGQRTIDSTGNYSITESGTITEVSDPLGDGGSSGGHNNNNKMHIDGFNGAIGGSARTHTMWIRIGDGNYGILDYGVNATGQRYTVRVESSRLRLEIQGGYKRSSTVIADDIWHMVSIKNAGSGTFPTNTTFHIDGAEPSYTQAGNTALNSRASSDNYLIFANEKQSTRPTNEHGEQWLRLFEVSNDQDVLEYQNQSNPAGFWTTGTPEATAGGASDEIITFLGSESLTVSLNDTLEPYKEVAETASLTITVTDSVNVYKEVDSTSPLSINLDDSMDSYKEVASTNSLSVSMSESADSYKELAETDALSIDMSELFTPYKELSESLALALSKLGTFTSLKEFAASIGLQCDTLGTLNKIAEITGNQGMLLDISGNFTTQIEGYSELQGIARLTVSGVGAFNKIEEFYSLSTLSTQQSASVVSIKDMQGIIGLQNSLVGTTRKISLFNEVLPLQVELVDSLNKIVRLSDSQNVTIDTYGIVYDAIDDAEKIESVIANIEGKLVVLEVSGLLSTTKITSSLSSNIKIAGKLNH